MFAGRKSRVGFTLVELLAVMAIIAILISMLVPAVNAVRETARSTACRNNISQLVLAMINYESVHKVFPINWSNDSSMNGENTRGHSWLTLILPQLEQEPLYKRVKFGERLGYKESGASASSGRWNRFVATQPLSIFRCPTDNHRGYMDNQVMLKGEMMGVTNYKACAGSNWGSEYVQGTGQKNVKYTKGRNAYQTDGRDRGNGIISRGARKLLYTTASSDIKDGLSNTFAVGEGAPLWDGYSTWYGWDNATSTCGIPLNYNQNSRRTSDDPYGALRRRVDNFFSRHPGGANFGFCDRSARWISTGIDYVPYRALGTIDAEDIIGEY